MQLFSYYYHHDCLSFLLPPPPSNYYSCHFTGEKEAIKVNEQIGNVEKTKPSSDQLSVTIFSVLFFYVYKYLRCVVSLSFLVLFCFKRPKRDCRVDNNFPCQVLRRNVSVSWFIHLLSSRKNDKRLSISLEPRPPGRLDGLQICFQLKWKKGKFLARPIRWSSLTHLYPVTRSVEIFGHLVRISTKSRQYPTGENGETFPTWNGWKEKKKGRNKDIKM